MWARTVAVCLWSLAAASAVLWHRQGQDEPALVAGGTTAPQAATAGAAQPQARADLSRFLGQATAATAPPNARPERVAEDFQLTGVVMRPADGAAGLALLAVQGQAPRAVRVGQVVSPGWQLVAVGRRHADLLGPQQALITLQLPEPGAGAGTASPPGPAAAAAPFSRPPALQASGPPAPGAGPAGQ